MTHHLTLVRKLPRGRSLPILVAVVFVLLQSVLGGITMHFPDSSRYGRAAVQHTGTTRAEASREAIGAYCAGQGAKAGARKLLDPLAGSADVKAVRKATAETCLAGVTKGGNVATDDARYQAIFDSRVGYPLLATPFVAALGVPDGMVLLGLLTAAAGSLLVVGLLRYVGLPLRAALLGQIIFLASPLGWWSKQPLTEGPVTVSVLGAVWGVLLLVRQERVLPGVLLVFSSLTACALIRYSTALVFAIALAAVACAAYRTRRKTALPLAGVSLTCAAATALAIKVLGLPSTTVTLQETFTRKFRYPEVADPWAMLVELNVRYWNHWLTEQSETPLFLVLTALACWALFRREAMLGTLAAASAVVGVIQVAAHPVITDTDRLGVLMWMPVVLGLPLLPQATGEPSQRYVPGPSSPAVHGRPVEV